MLPALDITYMTLQELDQALSSPATNPATVPYLEYALNQYMDALITGQQLVCTSIVYKRALEAPCTSSRTVSASSISSIVKRSFNLVAITITM